MKRTTFLAAGSRSKTLPVWTARSGSLEKDIKAVPEEGRAWLKATGWTADAGAVALLPGKGGRLTGAVLGLGKETDPARRAMLAGALPRILPAGDYRFETGPEDPELSSLAWVLGSYRFERYKGKAAGNGKARRLALPQGVNADRLSILGEAVAMGRDLINIPANDFGPDELEKAARAVAKTGGASVKVIKGDALLKQNFPMIHAVGRASTRAPRLIDFSWGQANAPKVTLVGKGVCYDTGGLSIKPTGSMALMKKDMGGAAAVLALAQMIMGAKLKVRLRVLIPAVENSISGNAYRPGDVLPSRKGLNVEIGNTDAEGRLVLADALALGDEDKSDVMLTMATLTGAARVALGPDLPPFYCTDEAFAAETLANGAAVDDPLWRMPFWEPYDQLLKARTGEVNHISQGAFAGSVTAAMFLKRFVSDARIYSHFDIYGWVPQDKPGRPEGGEPQGARALFRTFEDRYGK